MTPAQLAPLDFPADEEGALDAAFGDPDQYIEDGLDAAWRAEILSRSPVVFPGPVQYSARRSLMLTRAHVHKRLVGAFVEVFEALRKDGAWRLISDCGGVYAFRNRRGGGRLSVHGYAAAIDLNVAELPLGKKPDPKSMFVRFVVPVFEAHGWTWGGRWPRPDGMHFECTRRVR